LVLKYSKSRADAAGAPAPWACGAAVAGVSGQQRSHEQKQQATRMTLLLPINKLAVLNRQHIGIACAEAIPVYGIGSSDLSLGRTCWSATFNRIVVAA